MTNHRKILKLTALAAIVSLTLPAGAQESGSMQVGGATVSVGAGTAILTLPDVPSFVTEEGLGAQLPFVRGFKFSDDFGDEIGWNVNGSVAVPMGANKTVSVNGFWANIDDKDSATCTAMATTVCSTYRLFDDPAITEKVAAATATGNTLISTAEREVDHWGVSLESAWSLNPGIMGITRTPRPRTLSLGADIRGIDQDLDATLSSNETNLGPATYAEDLDTRYYGAYASWGGDYTLPFLSAVAGGLGLQSSFLLRGGVYWADTDYKGRINDLSATPNTSSTLSLSRDEVSFIGGVVLETRKLLGRRATLSLRSEYEYYSYVPEMAYNTVDIPTTPFTAGRQDGTVIGSDAAFSARTSIRLTIKLGPDSIMEPLK